MKVSIIIPVYNAEDFITDCLNSVANQTFPREEMEIIVVNDGSTDKTAEILDEFVGRQRSLPGPTWFKVIHQDNQGPATARTAGLKEAKGDYVFILSHDCIAAPDWVETTVNEFEKDKNLGIVQGQILPEHEINTPIFHCTRLEQFSPHFETAAIAYRAKVLDKAGRYFDENLSEFGDDTELAWRILEQGFTSKWLPKITAYHKVLPQPFFKEIKKAWGCQKFPLLVKKHPGLRKYLRFGFIWDGPSRPIKIGIFILWLLFLPITLEFGIWSTIGGLIFGILYILGNMLKVWQNTQNWSISVWERLLVVPHSFLTELVGTIALCYGAIRQRVFVI